MQASTGIAACNIGGMTLHSFAGAGLCNESKEVVAKKVMDNKRSRTRWQNTHVLIVDESIRPFLNDSFFSQHGRWDIL